MYGWIEGDLLDAELVPDLTAFARDLAGFLAALYACKPDGPAPGDHSFARGGPVSIWDDQTRATLADVDGTVDTRGALAVWETALTARHEAPPVWAHGDVTGANLLVRDGRLVGVLDFGCSAVGDPACDLTIAWTFFAGESRVRFKGSVPVEESAWARGARLGAVEGAAPPGRRSGKARSGCTVINTAWRATSWLSWSSGMI